jgi:hypothetical protein
METRQEKMERFLRKYAEYGCIFAAACAYSRISRMTAYTWKRDNVDGFADKLEAIDRKQRDAVQKLIEERAKQVRKEERLKVLRMLGVAAALLAALSVVVYLIWRVF